MSLLKEVFFKKDKNFKSQKGEPTEIIDTFYGRETRASFNKRFYFVHFILKYKLFLPLAIITYKLINKRLIKKTPDKPQFKYIKTLEDSYDQAVIDWSMMYLDPMSGRIRTSEQIKKAYNDKERGTLFFLRMLKELTITITSNDDAYAEFLPFLLTRIAQNLQETPKSHLLHAPGGITDPVYEKVYKALLRVVDADGVAKPVLKNVGRQTK